LTHRTRPLNCRSFFPDRSPHTAYETHLSTIQTHPETTVRFPQADENQERSRDPLAPRQRGRKRLLPKGVEVHFKRQTDQHNRASKRMIWRKRQRKAAGNARRAAALAAKPSTAA